MKTYTVTEKPFDEKLTTTRGIVYTAVQKSGPSGITREDFAQVVDGLMVLSGAYHRLNDLVKDGFVSVSGQSQSRKPWASEPGTSGPSYEKLDALDSERAHERAAFVRSKPKWKCPSCGKWTTDDISKSCSACRPPEWTKYIEEADAESSD